MTRKLGEVQLDVLRSLIEHKRWSNGGGCGWVWNTPSGTVRVLESLVGRKLARKVRLRIMLHGRDINAKRDYYYPTKAGREEVLSPRYARKET